MARLKHYRFGIDVGVADRWQVTLHIWRWSWTFG